MATATGVILPVLSATAHSKKIVSNAPVIANIFQTAFAIHNHAQQPLIQQFLPKESAKDANLDALSASLHSFVTFASPGTLYIEDGAI